MEERRKFDLPGSGLQCRTCSEILPRVARTIEGENIIERKRKCPHCGSLNETEERVVNSRPLRARRRVIDRDDYL